MPQTKSRKKDLRQAEKHREANREVKKTAKLAVRAARESSDPQGPEVKAAYKAIDKSAKKGILHRHTAARRKSRLMKDLNTAKPAA